MVRRSFFVSIVDTHINSSLASYRRGPLSRSKERHLKLYSLKL